MIAAVTLAAGLLSWSPVHVGADDTYRTFDGTGNNIDNPHWGSANIQLIRPRTDAYYGDDGSTPVDADRPSPRAISNAVVDEEEFGSAPNFKGLSSFFWQWGQFIDHDIVHPRTHKIPTLSPCQLETNILTHPQTRREMRRLNCSGQTTVKGRAHLQTIRASKSTV
jgi:hypothetical protein